MRELSEIDRYVFVCKGNICRSPLGEGIIKSKGLKAISFGLGTGDGFPADERSIAFAARRGIDLTAHRTTNIKHYNHVQTDLILVPEPAHAIELRSRLGPAANIALIGLWSKEKRVYLHDPYNTLPEYYEKCSNIVTEGAEFIFSLHKR